MQEREFLQTILGLSIFKRLLDNNQPSSGVFGKTEFSAGICKYRRIVSTNPRKTKTKTMANTKKRGKYRNCSLLVAFELNTFFHPSLLPQKGDISVTVFLKQGFPLCQFCCKVTYRWTVLSKCKLKHCPQND